ncbi:MAG TPA: T9SS type A sorting domain-containing protein [Saprospiraceae bacterium]|nr:T9SS type A sorting domain-containing protein [Saprospiraceae bacterium]
MKQYIILFICLIAFKTVSATHIIGGSLAYRDLGNSIYEIRLEVLRDCYNGGNAPFDDPASVGIFNNVGFEPIGYPDGQVLIAFDELETSILDSTSACSFPSDVCVVRTVYVKTVVLPPVEGGWTLSYQRCCRSVIILNLIDPLNTGMTFETHINSTIVNSTPAFKKNVPYAVFVNTAFVYDASATDADGDSLAYELITPYVGGDMLYNMPHPPPPPPYQLALFKPPYSLSNMLGGNYPLTINPKTGEMTAIPPTVGSFQIAYVVKEYRNDTLIGTNAREFAFVVTYPPPNLNYDVTGSVLINDTIPLDLGKVQLFQRDITTDSLYLYDEQEIGPGASYAFEDIPGGVFYIKAIVDTGSVYFDTYLPTYYNSAFFWYKATPVNQCDTSQYYRDIHLIHIDSLVGIHILDGTVFNSGRSFDPVPGLNLLLANASGDPIQYRTTDENGYFKFEHLPSGSYQLFADLINSEIDNSHPPHININGNKTVEVYLYKDSLSLQEPTGVRPVNRKDELVIHVYPNPASDKFMLEVLDEEDKMVSYEILDVNGNVFNSGMILTNDPVQISIADLVTGIYIIKVEDGSMLGLRRILKEK